MLKLNTPTKYYLGAKETVISSGFKRELEWQEKVTQSPVNEQTFLREGAWVILCSGFKESYVRKVFDYITLCFCEWENADEIIKRADVCEATANYAFKNERKIRAITQMSHLVANYGFGRIQYELKKDPINFLQTFPMIGPITSFHLAKNLGLPVAKPDRHLVKIAASFGYECVQNFCLDIAEETGENIAVIDITLWRYAALGHA